MGSLSAATRVMLAGRCQVEAGHADTRVVRYYRHENGGCAYPKYAGYRFPSEISAQTVWLYFQLALNCRDMEELLVERR